MKNKYYIMLLISILFTVLVFWIIGYEDSIDNNTEVILSESDIGMSDEVADSRECYSSVIENTSVFTMALNDTDMTPEKAAYELAVMLMEDMRCESDARSFRITEFKDLFVKVYDILSLDEEMCAIYCIEEFEKNENTWLVEISCSYKYIGTISPIGPSQNEWVDILYQGSPIGFIMQRGGDKYTLQSRYGYYARTYSD